MNEKVNHNTEYWQELDRRHHLHPFVDTAELNLEGAKIINKASGVYVWDTDGQKFLDGMAGLWCVNMGYSQPSLIAAATEQMTNLPYYNTFFKTATTPQAELAAKIAEVAPEGLEHTFFSSSGSEANDTVVRLVRHFWQVQGYDNKTIIVSRENAYHGSTIAGLSLGGMATMHGQGGDILPDIVHIPQPYWYGEGGDLSPEEFGLARAQELEKTILEHGADRIAAFIGEPIQGAGGVIVPPASYWPEIQRICRKYDILLVADEVICGFGRTGAWFGSDAFNIQPDLMTIAKGLSSGYMPISGVIVGTRVVDVMTHQFGKFFHGYTYSGHPVAAAVALANIELMQQTNIIETLQEDTVPYFQAMVQRIGKHSTVAAAEGLGMLAGFALVEDRAEECREYCLEEGLIMRAVGSLRLVLSPPLVISRAEIDELEEKVMKALDRLASE